MSIVKLDAQFSSVAGFYICDFLCFFFVYGVNVFSCHPFLLCVVGTTTPFHSSSSTNLPSLLKGHQKPYSAPHNTLDSTMPRIKRGKEREIPKVKRPTALKKVTI